MKSKNIKSKIVSGIEKASEHYYAVLRKFDKDENHKFRVAIKKLRAFIRLIRLTQPGCRGKLPAAVKNFYHLAGDIRNLQVQEERIRSLCHDLSIHPPEIYLQYLHKEQESKKNAAIEMRGKIPFIDFKSIFSNDACADVPDESKNAFLQEMLARLAQLLSRSFYDDETLHETRKVIKDIMYNYAHLEDQINSSVPAPFGNLDFMHALTDALGDYHDLSVTFYYLSSFSGGLTRHAVEKQTLYELQSHVELRKTDFRNELVHMLTPVKNWLKHFQANVER